MSEDGWLVGGLGNPGPRYARTRHNVGYLVVEELAGRVGGAWRTHRSRRADLVEARLAGSVADRVLLVRPRSYMNEIGGPVAAVLRFFRLPPERVVAVHDELDLPCGALRVKHGGGDNGHNGLRSMRAALATGDFHRVRVGIGRPLDRQDPADFVLCDFRPAERRDLPDLVGRAADAVDSLVRAGLERTQQEFNG